MFGNGGNEGHGIDFFDDSKVLLSVVAPDGTTLEIEGFTNAAHLALFGDGILDDSMLPTAITWVEPGSSADDEPGLVGWHHLSSDEWRYGNLGVPGSPELDARLQNLADSLGVTVADLGYVVGSPIPDDILALIEANNLFGEAGIEDIRNLNLNFIIDLGDVEGEQVTLRISPSFADIVERAETQQGFAMAAHLDAAANIPHWDLGNAGTYDALITEILGMSDDEAAAALQSLGFGFLPAFSSLSFEFARNQMSLLNDTWPRAGGASATISSKGNAAAMQMGEDTYWLVGLGGARADYDQTGSSLGYDLDFSAVSVGFERFTSDALSYGVLLGASDGTADAEGGAGSIDATGLSLAGFVRGRFGAQGFFQAVLGYQDLSYDSTRSVQGMTATGKTDGSQVFASVEGEYLYNQGAWRYGPIASVEYYDTKIDAFDETGAGAFNLSVGKQSGSLLLGSVGVRGEYAVPGSSGDTLLTGSLAYTVANGDNITVQTGFVGLPGVSYPLEGRDDNWVDLQLGVESELSRSGGKTTSLSAGYHGAFGSDYESHGLHLGLIVSF